MTIPIILVIVGFVSLIFGANWLVDGASALAKKHNISNLAIGLTIVAFGTSAPELVVNTIASFQGHSDIVLGNIIGSNNFNIFLILGIAGLIYPLTVQSSTVWREIPISLVAALLLLLLGNGVIGNVLEISRIDGAIMFLAFLLFLFYVYKQLKANEIEVVTSENKSNARIWDTSKPRSNISFKDHQTLSI